MFIPQLPYAANKIIYNFVYKKKMKITRYNILNKFIARDAQMEYLVDTVLFSFLCTCSMSGLYYVIMHSTAITVLLTPPFDVYFTIY